MENQKIHKKLERRIAIIGAGAAGLTAAETLKEKGYSDITIFEKSDYAGGKCISTEIDGLVYELGAGILSGNNTTVLRLVKKFSIIIERVKFGDSKLVDYQTGKTLPRKSIGQMMLLIKQICFTYRKLSKKHKNAMSPGLSKVHPDLFLPFSYFIKKYKIELLAKEFELFFTGFGYGYFDEIPAVYVVKYYSWNTIKAFVKRRIYFLPNGIQHLWTVIAKNHNVKFNTTIKHIKRDDKITVTTNTEQLVFEDLIITSPLDESLKFLEGGIREKKLFKEILNIDYRTVACSIVGLEKSSGFMPGNFSSSRKGHPIFWHQRHASKNIYTFYTIADTSISDEEVIQNIKRLVEKMKGRVEKLQTVKHCKYFPHVSAGNIKRKYFDTLESMQGNFHTYYAGELMNFSSVGLTSEYAEELIERYF